MQHSNPLATVAFSIAEQQQGGQLNLQQTAATAEAEVEEEARAPARRGPKRGRAEDEEVMDEAPKVKKKVGRGRVRTLS